VKPEYQIVNALPEHAVNIAPNLRARDAREIRLACGLNVVDGLLWALSSSPLAWAAIDDEGVIAIWGVGSLSMLSDVGQPWLVGTERLVKKYRKAFLRLVDLFLDMIVDAYPMLEGYQLAEHGDRVRWLQWCGFKFDKPEIRGGFGMEYQRFELKRETCLSSL
jgi:hypothetical protein